MSLILYLVLATAISIQTINGQTIRSHIICDVDEVMVNVNSSGVIQHVQRDSSISCTLLLSGFVSGGYVSIPGVDPEPSFGGCIQDTTVTINDVPYCVRGEQSNNQVIVKLTNVQLNITLPSADVPGFELNYYSNVAVCGTDLRIPDGAEVNQLSGVISSSYDPSQFKILPVCTVRLIDLPRPSVYVRFELLHTGGLSDSIRIGDQQFTPSNNKGSALLVTTDSERTIDVNYTTTEFVEISFVLNFTVLHCGDIPAMHVPYSINSTTTTPWLPGSMVTYVCVDGWMLKYDTNSTIECIVDRSRKVAVWSNHSNIQCIPEPWCHSTPNAIDNSTYVLSEDNLTATYQCVDGYTTNSSVTDRTINCTSSDRDTTPWIWSSPPSFVCAPVECNLTSGYQNITNGNVTDKRYYYTQQLQYQCDTGYIRKDEVVECTSDGSWSALPVCVPTTSTTSATSTTSTKSIGSATSTTSSTSVKGALQLSGEELIITVSASSSGGLVLLVAIVVLGACLYRRRAGNSGPKTATNGVTSATEQEPDVPLDSVDEVSPYATTTSLSPTSLPSASNYPDSSATYADVQKIIGRPSPAPARAEHPTGPLYEEAPILPPRLEDRPVEMVDNNLYAAQGDVAPPQGAATAESVEMLENNLYGSGY